MVAIVSLSTGRLSLCLPVSGHALVIAFVVILRVARRSRPLAVYELVVSVGFLAVIAYIKLVVWLAPITLGLGVGMSRFAIPARLMAPDSISDRQAIAFRNASAAEVARPSTPPSAPGANGACVV